MFQRALWLAVLASVFLVPARADFAAGQRAWDAGRVDEALAQWSDAAHAGDGQAMRALGQVHLQGFGVLQDFIEAHKWFNLAASRGDVEAAQERDALAGKMTPEQAATEAQEVISVANHNVYRSTWLRGRDGTVLVVVCALHSVVQPCKRRRCT